MKKVAKISLFLFVGFVALVCLMFGYRDLSVEDLKTKYAPHPSSFVEIEDMNVHYRDEGNPLDSLPIVLIHGTASSLHTFNGWTTGLKEDKRVIRMDLPAFGLTGPFPDRDYSIEHYVSFLEDFLDAKGVDRCILGGNSLGGLIAWKFVVKRPEMVDKLILIDAAGYPMNSTSVPLAFKLAQIPVLNKILTFITPRFVVQASVENVYEDDSKISEELVDRYFELTLRSGNRQAFVDRMGVSFDTNLSDIKNIQHPTLILWGEKDALITTESAYRFQEDLPNDTLVILENAGHVPMEEIPEESLNVVLNFINK